jgi:hypothetical protein
MCNIFEIINNQKLPVLEWIALDNIEAGEELFMSLSSLDEKEYQLVCDGDYLTGRPFIYRRIA